MLSWHIVSLEAIVDFHMTVLGSRLKRIDLISRVIPHTTGSETDEWQFHVSFCFFLSQPRQISRAISCACHARIKREPPKIWNDMSCNCNWGRLPSLKMLNQMDCSNEIVSSLNHEFKRCGVHAVYAGHRAKEQQIRSNRVAKPPCLCQSTLFITRLLHSLEASSEKFLI